MMPTRQSVIHQSPNALRSLSTSYENVSLYTETPRNRQKSPQTRNKAFGAVGDTSTMGTGSNVNRKADNKQDLKEEFTAAKTTQADKRKFTLPLSVIFLLECALILTALVIIIAVSQDRMTKSFKDMINTNIKASLAYAATEVKGPITNIESVLVDYRNRLIDWEFLNFGYKPCGTFGDTAELYYSARALSDMSTVVRSYPSVLLLYTVRLSTDHFDNVTGAPQLIQCAATASEVRLVMAGDNEVTLRPVNSSDFYDIEAVPRGRKSDSELGLDSVYETLTRPLVGWVPTVEQDSLTNTAVLTLVGSVPIQVNRTDLLTGISDIYTPEPGEAAPSDTALQALDSIGTSVSLASFGAVMRSITDDDPDAHTSLYDLAGGTLLCTSLPGFSQFDSTHQMWPSGDTPSSSLNDAFNAVEASTLTVNNPRILFQPDTVVSATVVTTPFGVRFVIVRSTPRSYYFGSIDSVRNMMIIIGALAVVLTVGTATIIAVTIQAGVSKVKDNMEVAAALRNERVEPSHSLITEINQLCIAFDQMNDKLIVARAYLPQHMLVPTDDSALEDDEGEYGHAEEAISATAHRSRHMSEASPSPQAPMPAPETLLTFDGVNFVEKDNVTLPAANLTSKDTRKEAIGRVPPSGANGLSTKRVTILSVNVRGFHSNINVCIPNTVIEPTTDITETISNICNSERGVIDSFHGDHFVLSFNAARHNAEGPQKAARCAMDIIAGHEGLMEFSMGLSTGKACVGHLGTATLKRLSIIGEVYSRAIANERMCRLNFASNRGTLMIQHVDGEVTASSDAIQCIADGIMAAEIQHTCLLQLLGAQSPTLQEVSQAAKLQQQLSENSNANVTANLVGSGPIPADKLLFGVRGSVKKGGGRDGDEWLYEINHNNSPFLSQINAAMMAYLTATRSEALNVSPGNCVGDTTEAQNRLLNEAIAIRNTVVGKASASFAKDADPSKLPQSGFFCSSGLQQGGALSAPLLREEAIGQSAIQYATSVATSRQQGRDAAGLIRSQF